MMRRLGVALFALSTLVAPLTTSALAGTIPAPAGEVVLRVSGQIANRTDGTAALFDMAALEALPAAHIVTTTAWTEGDVAFDGVLLRDLLAAVGADGNTLSAIAINDYAISIPVSDAQYDVIIAYRMNGEPMSVRDKGPLWVVYPVSQNPELKGPDTEAKMIWQLRELAVK